MWWWEKSGIDLTWAREGAELATETDEDGGNSYRGKEEDSRAGTPADNSKV